MPPPELGPVWRLYNARKPFSGRVSTLGPDKGAHSAPPSPVAGAEGLAVLTPRTPPPFSPLSQNRRLGRPQYDELDLLMFGLYHCQRSTKVLVPFRWR